MPLILFVMSPPMHSCSQIRGEYVPIHVGTNVRVVMVVLMVLARGAPRTGGAHYAPSVSQRAARARLMPRRACSGDAREQETTSAPAGPHCLREHGPRRGCCVSARRRSDGTAASLAWDVQFKLKNGHTPSVDLVIIVFGCGKLRRNRVCQAACVANSCLPRRRALYYNTVV